MQLSFQQNTGNLTNVYRQTANSFYNNKGDLNFHQFSSQQANTAQEKQMSALDGLVNLKICFQVSI
jgi:hypothetical protein